MNITINELPKYSPWPERLLGLAEFQFRPKTPDEVTREYDADKWGKLLSVVRENDSLTFEDMEKSAANDNPKICVSQRDTLTLMSAELAEHTLFQLVNDALIPQLPASAIVELGCGYGRLLLRLARKLPDTPVFGGEYTQSGVELLRILANRSGLDVHAGWCDFSSPSLTDLSIPTDAIIFTCFATHCVPTLDMRFVESLIERKPKVVIHIEPCMEHSLGNDMLSVLRRAYIVRNDYNRNLLTLLKEAESRGLLRIDEEILNEFGTNPLLSASLIRWIPIG